MVFFSLGLMVLNSEYWLSLSLKGFLRAFFFFFKGRKGGGGGKPDSKKSQNKTKKDLMWNCFLHMNVPLLGEGNVQLYLEGRDFLFFFVVFFFKPQP